MRFGAQWLRFALVGASNTVLYAAVYMTLERLGVHYVVASIVAFVVGALNSYVLNRRWTFRSEAPRAPELARFVCAQLLGVVASLALLAALVEVARFHHLAAQAVAFPVASLLTFALSRQWAFVPATASWGVETPARMHPRWTLAVQTGGRPSGRLQASEWGVQSTRLDREEPGSCSSNTAAPAAPRPR
jgi:putative flippase GtrA